MTSYEKELSKRCYDYYKTSNSKKFTYLCNNGNDMIHATNAINYLEDCGYISNVEDNGISLSFTIEDSLIHYMEQEEI